MNKLTTAFTTTALTLVASAQTAWAQQGAGPGPGPGPDGDRWYGHHPHMWGGMGGMGGMGEWGGYGYGFHGPLMWVFWIVIIGLAIWAVMRLSGCHGGRCGHRRGRTDALAILEERFAKGEIDVAEFEARKKALGG